MTSAGRAWIDRLPDELDGQRAILRRLLAVSEADERIRWLVVSCSIGRGNADRLSDLDLGVGVSDERFDEALGDIRYAVDHLGDLVDSYHHQIAGLTMRHERIFAQYADRCQVDLVVIPASEQVGQIRDEVVLYDPGQHVTGSFEQQPVPPEQVREWAFGGWCALADLGKYLRRGSAWEALDRLHEARAQLWRLTATALGVPNPQFGLTSILDFAPDRLPDAVTETVGDLDPARLLAATRSLASQLRAAGAGLTADQRAALPLAMAAYITADLDAIR